MNKIIVLIKKYLDNKIEFQQFENDFYNIYFNDSVIFTQDEMDVIEDINTDFGYCVIDDAIRDDPSYIDENELRKRLKININKLEKLKDQAA